MIPDITIQRIKALMDERNIKAKTLTAELELPSSSITEWSKGKAKPSTVAIVKIATYFGVTSDYLLGLSDTRNFPKPSGVAKTNSKDEIDEIVADFTPEEIEEAKNYLLYLKEKYEKK